MRMADYSKATAFPTKTMRQIAPKIIALWVFSTLLCSGFLAATEKEPPPYPVAKRSVLIDWRDSWLFWASDDPPADWPLTALPYADNAVELHPLKQQKSSDERALFSSQRDQNDRVMILRSGIQGLKTDARWWHGHQAPFSAYSELRWLAYQKRWKKARRTYRKRYKKYPTRTQLIFPTGLPPDALPSRQLQIDPEAEERGLTTLYFAKEFQVSEPESFAGLQIFSRFNKGIRIFINGTLVAQSRMNPDDIAHNAFGVEMDVPDFIEMDVGTADWWETQWNYIPAEVLKPGTNVISAVVHKAQSGGRPSLHFDLKLHAWEDTGWLELPYLHHVRQDGVTLSWETNRPSTGRIHLKRIKNGETQTIESSTLGLRHEVQIRELSVGEEYSYTVEALVPTKQEGEPIQLQTETRRFHTTPDDNADFSFLFYGDSRSGFKIHKKIADLMHADREEHQSRVVLHAGDIVSGGWRWDRWQTRFFGPAWPLLSEVPIYPVVGNHEENQKLYYDYFDLPHNESWYYFRYGIVDFYALNTNVDFKEGSEQHQWFEKALEESTAPWKVAFFHHPPYSCSPSRKPGSRKVQKHLVPLLEKYEVDLVLLGHDHLYSRSVPINGVTYVVSGGGGSPLYGVELDSRMAFCEKKYNYMRLHVSEEMIRWVAIDEEGELIEEFELLQKETPEQ